MVRHPHHRYYRASSRLAWASGTRPFTTSLLPVPPPPHPPPPSLSPLSLTPPLVDRQHCILPAISLPLPSRSQPASLIDRPLAAIALLPDSCPTPPSALAYSGPPHRPSQAAPIYLPQVKDGPKKTYHAPEAYQNAPSSPLLAPAGHLPLSIPDTSDHRARRSDVRCR